jgi:hypothetical protein
VPRLVLAILFSLIISVGSLQAAFPGTLTTTSAPANPSAELQKGHPVHLCGLVPEGYRVKVLMQGPGDDGYIYHATPSINPDSSWCLDTTLAREGNWNVRISAYSETGEWVGYLDQFTLTASATSSIATVQLQQGTDGYEGTTDCYISDWAEGDTTKNFGVLEPSTLRLRKVDRKSALLRFELDGVPSNVHIQHAFLGIYAFFNSNPSGPTYFAYQMLRPWSEDQATWRSPRAGETWAEPGAMGEGIDRKADYLDKVCRPVTSPEDTCGVIIPGWHQFDITEAVQAWVNGEPNYGVMLRSWDPFWASSAENSFRSSEWQQIAMRPRLIIYYTQEETTPTPTPTATSTAVPTVTPTATPTNTPLPPGPGTISGSVRYQGRGNSPSAAWESPLIVTAHLPGNPNPAYTFNVTSDQNGNFVVPSGIAPGVYDVGVRNMHSLRNLQPNVAISASTAPLDMGLLREGDANLDNWVNALDFSLLNSAYWKQVDEEGFDSRTDFNEDDWVNALDFSLLNANYWQQGDAANTEEARLASDASQSPGNVILRVAPFTKTVADEQVFAVDVYLDAGTHPVDSVDCIMSYDPAYLQGRSITPGSALPQPLGNIRIADGVIEYHHSVYAGSPPVSGSFKLFTLEFQAQAPISATSLTFDAVFVAGAGVGHAITKQSGAISILTTTTPPTPAPLGKIEGVAFLDVVENDALDPDEPGVGGVTIQLLSQQNNLLDIRQTDGNGRYAFEDLPAATYRIRVSRLPAGYALVDPLPRMVGLSNGDTGTVNLGLRRVNLYGAYLPLILRAK